MKIHNIEEMKMVKKILGFIFIILWFNSCVEQKISLARTTWIATDGSFNSLYMVSFIDDKVAYIIKDDYSGSSIFEALLDVYGNGIEHNTIYYQSIVKKLAAYIDSYEPYRGFVGNFRVDPYFPFDYSVDWDLYGYQKYETINVGTHTISGEKDGKEWQFTYTMENGNLTLELPKELNSQNRGTQFTKRIIGNHVSQPIGIWKNNSGEFFFFSNPETIKKWGMGTYVSWDYTFDDEYITWSGNKDSGKRPYSVDSEKQQIKLILPGDIIATTLTLVSNKFVIIF
jgi:hypothetical protein